MEIIISLKQKKQLRNNSFILQFVIILIFVSIWNFICCQNVKIAHFFIIFILKVIFFLLAVFEINHILFFNLMDLIFNFLMIRFVAKHFFS